MALRDWQGWHLGIVWAFGIGVAWLVGRLGVSAVSDGAAASADSTAATGAVTAGGAPLWTTVVVLLVMTVLITITVRWVRGRILDQ